MIKAVIFDLGNVLIDFDYNIAVKKILPFCSKTSQELFDFFFDSELTGLFEQGKILPLAFFFKVKKALDLKLGYDKFLPIWNEIFFLTDNNRAVYKLSLHLRQYYKIALLSNINILHFDYLKNNFPIFNAFHSLVLSFELKLKKPDPLIYQKALDILNILPEEAFYTDDRQELVEQSRQLGMQGFVFKGIEQLNKDLSDSGIKL